MEVKGTIVESTGGFFVAQVDKEQYEKLKESDIEAYCFEETDKVVKPSGTGEKTLYITKRGYFIDGSEQVIFKAVLEQTEEPYVKPE